MFILSILCAIATELLDSIHPFFFAYCNIRKTNSNPVVQISELFICRHDFDHRRLDRCKSIHVGISTSGCKSLRSAWDLNHHKQTVLWMMFKLSSTRPPWPLLVCCDNTNELCPKIKMFRPPAHNPWRSIMFYSWKIHERDTHKKNLPTQGVAGRLET